MLFTLSLAVASIAATADAPDRLLTRQGVDIVMDEGVFALFAALNAAGYSEESARKGPPLVAPIYHPVRADARTALRAASKTASLDALRKIFEAHPLPIEVYLEAVIADEQLSPPARKLRSALIPKLDRFRSEAALEALFDGLAERQRAHALELRERLEQDFDRAQKLMGERALRAPQDLVVVPNLLDGHAYTRVVRSGSTRYLVVGPGSDSARRAVLEETVTAAARPAAKKALDGAPSFQASWDGLRASRRIRLRYGDGAHYLARGVAAAVAHRVEHAQADREADEEFIDDQAKLGMRWARAGLRLVDMAGAAPLTNSLPALARKVSP